MPDAQGVKDGNKAAAIDMTKYLRFMMSRNSHFLSKPLQKNRVGVTVGAIKRTEKHPWQEAAGN
jgi:hypothetical protein